MHKNFIVGFFFTLLLSVVGYQAYSQNQVTLNNHSLLANTEMSPCEESHPDQINDEEILEVKKIDPDIGEIEDYSKKLTLQNILITYFNVENLSNIVISQQTTTHAQGEFGQKWWLAFNDKEDGWKIISTGCSYINCHEINGYDFPSEMVPVCWDNSSNQLINQ